MIYVACNVQTGDLLQTSAEPIGVSGHPLMVKTFDMPMPDMTRYEWDRGGLSFVAKSTERKLTKLQYLRRFTQQERINIRNAAGSSPELYDYLAMLELAEEIDLDDPDTVGAVNMLEMVGLIAAGRADEVLA